MKKTAIFLFSFLLLISCTNDEQINKEVEIRNKEIERLSKEKISLEQNLSERDKTIEQLLVTFNHIQQNLDEITNRKQDVLLNKNNEDLTSSDRENLIQEDFQKIADLLYETKQSIVTLKKTLKENNINIEQLETLIDDLQEKVAVKDKEIEALSTQLGDVNTEYVAVFDAYLEKSDQLEQAIDALNTAYYCYGTYNELIKNEVITKEGGFVGIGKVKKIREDFNKDYFESVNIKYTEEIKIYAKNKVEFMTTHPKVSYTIEQNEAGGSFTIKIKDAEDFWKISKYLVIIVN